MKRFHVHLHVYDLESNIRFFSSLFAAAPVLRSADSAQWVLEDPRLAFTISSEGSSPGLKLLGIHADTAEELERVREQFVKADDCAAGEPLPAAEDAAADTHWLIDPQGILWEARRASRN